MLLQIPTMTTAPLRPPRCRPSQLVVLLLHQACWLRCHLSSCNLLQPHWWAALAFLCVCCVFQGWEGGPFTAPPVGCSCSTQRMLGGEPVGSIRGGAASIACLGSVRKDPQCASIETHVVLTHSFLTLLHLSYSQSLSLPHVPTWESAPTPLTNTQPPSIAPPGALSSTCRASCCRRVRVLLCGQGWLPS